MIELTIGYTAGIIALGIFIVQLWCPTALTYILAGILREKETAATWSVAARSLQSSYWPTLLHADSSRYSGARLPVWLTSLAYPTIAILVTVAGVVTPLGLYDALEPSGSKSPSFKYAADGGAFGIATGPRLNHTFTRICGSLVPETCPGAGDNCVITMYGNGTLSSLCPFGIKSEVPKNVMEVYSSGTKGVHTTISNFFDIEWRQLTWARDTLSNPMYDNGSSYSVGRFQQIDSSILQDTYKLVEGLVVDARNGGIGFRNHTFPSGLPYGGVWKEDILFIEPETECVDTNLTIDFMATTNRNSTASSSVAGVTDLVLTDRGGFVNLVHKYPTFDRDISQVDPSLRARAYKGAWLNNALTALVLNVTNSANSPNYSHSWSYLNSKMNKSFPLTNLGIDFNMRGMFLDGTYGHYLGLDPEKDFVNPEGVTTSNFSDINIVCEGAGGADIANYTNIFTMCSMMRGAPHRTDGGYEGTFESGSRWSSPLYSCATAIKASIKTVTFQSNGEQNGLSDLQVTEIKLKEYESNDNAPVWGVENSGRTLNAAMPLWGLVSKAYESEDWISTLQQPSLYLPGYVGFNSLNSESMSENLPGNHFPFAVASSIPDGFQRSSITTVADYTGIASTTMLTRWRELAHSPDTAKNIINLVWTDISSSAVAGSRGVLGTRNMEPSEAVPINVSPVRRYIKYHLPFAIPALILSLVYLCITAGAALMALSMRGRMVYLQRALRHTSAGRIMATFLDPANSNLLMDSKEWNARNGRKIVDLTTSPPTLSSVSETNDDMAAARDGTPAMVSGDGTEYVYNYPRDTSYLAQKDGYEYAAAPTAALVSPLETPSPPPNGLDGQQFLVQGQPHVYTDDK